MLPRLFAFVTALLNGVSLAAAPAGTGKVYTLNDRGQILTVSDPASPASDTRYTYDANGNRTSKSQDGAIFTYKWDARDRLTTVIRNGQPLAKYRYDYAGRRVEKEILVAPATLVRFQYSGPWLESESNVIGNTIARYSRDADGKLISYRYLDATREVVTDGMGTPIALLTPQGAVVARYSYDPWGNRRRIHGNEEIPIGHTGYYFDRETGLYYAGARYYDPEIAAFISEDPIEGDVERPITLNRYVAFNANPTVYTDPDGRCGLAVMDIGECINNVAVAERWSAQETLEAQQIQYEAETRSAGARALNTIGGVVGFSALRAAAYAGMSAYAATGSWEFGLAVASTRAAPVVEAGAQIVANVPGPGIVPAGPLSSAAARTETVAAVEVSAARLLDNVPVPPAALPGNQVSIITEGMTPAQVPGASLTSKSGETIATSTGKAVHARLAAERRASGDFDLVNQPLADAGGKPIEVPRRVNLKTGEAVPESGQQVARPDAVRFQGDVIIDDKPLGRPIVKDQQEIIRFINAYVESQGRQPRTIGIQRYDPSTGTPVVTELYSPEYFQSWVKQ